MRASLPCVVLPSGSRRCRLWMAQLGGMESTTPAGWHPLRSRWRGWLRVFQAFPPELRSLLWCRLVSRSADAMLRSGMACLRPTTGGRFQCPQQARILPAPASARADDPPSPAPPANRAGFLRSAQAHQADRQTKDDICRKPNQRSGKCRKGRGLHRSAVPNHAQE